MLVYLEATCTQCPIGSQPCLSCPSALVYSGCSLLYHHCHCLYYLFHRLVKSPEDILRENFVNVGRDPQAFSSISYIGTRTEKPPTDFAVLLKAVEAHLSNSSVRSARTLPVIYNAIMVSQYNHLK